jgi:ABC-2 type transport system permease protein
VSPSRVQALAGRILKQFRHDPRTVALIVIVPMMVMALIGYLISDDKEPLPVAVANEDAGLQTPGGPVALGGDVLAALEHSRVIEVRPAGSAGEARRALEDQQVSAAIAIPADLTERMMAGEPVSIRVLVPGTEPGVEGPVFGALSAALAEVRRTSPGLPEAGAGLEVERVPLRGAGELSALDYDAPVLIAVFAFLFTFMLTSVAFLRERSSGTLERLMASPTSRLEILLGYLLGFIGFAAAQALVILGYAVWILDVRVAGPIWLVLLVEVILVVGVVNLGIALSFYARNELQVVQFIPMIFVPQIFLGGLFWPVETLHPILRWLSQLFPLTHAAVALRAVMVGGEGFGDIAGRLLALLAFAVAMVALGVTALRKQRA